VRGRKMSFRVEVSEGERAELRRWQQTPSMPAGLVRRGRAMLLLEAGYPLKDVVVLCGLSAKMVRKWARRFLDEGIAGLKDRPRPGRKPAFSPRGRPPDCEAGLRTAPRAGVGPGPVGLRGTGATAGR
jgi:hypothetical protein